MKILGISGSLRSTSTNTRLLRAAKQLAPADVELIIESSLGELPLFNPDVSVDSNSTVSDFATRFRVCDGVIVSSPVYAGGYPGALKNGLDWLVGTDAFVEKPFMMLSASNRVPHVEETLIAVLETMSGIHIQDASTVVPLLGSSLTAENIVKDQTLSTSIRTSVARLVSAIPHNSRKD